MGKTINVLIKTALQGKGFEQLNVSAREARAAIKAIVGNTRGFGKFMGAEFSQVERGAKGAKEQLVQMTIKSRLAGEANNKYTVLLKQTADGLQYVEGSLRKKTQALTKTTDAQKKANDEQDKAKKGTGALGKTSETTADSIFKLAKRSLFVVPIWSAMRTVVRTVTQAISDLAKTYAEYDVQMARVGTVNLDQIDQLGRLREAVLGYSVGASRGFAEAGKAMYALGSAGLTAQQQIAGLEHVMNVSIGTFGDTEEIAKLMAGSFNVFGKSMEGVYTDSAKLEKIANVLTFTYANQQVELSEIANAMTYVASVGDLMDIGFTELVATIGVLNTGMLKGSKSGTSLLNAFVQLANQTDRLADLGVAFDPTQPLDFKNVMQQLSDIYGDQGVSLVELKEIMEVFGRRGGRAAAQLITKFKIWSETIADTEATFDDFAESMKTQAESSLPAAFQRLWNVMRAGAARAFEDTAKLMKESINRAVDDIELEQLVDKYDAAYQQILDNSKIDQSFDRLKEVGGAQIPYQNVNQLMDAQKRVVKDYKLEFGEILNNATELTSLIDEAASLRAKENLELAQNRAFSEDLFDINKTINDLIGDVVEGVVSEEDAYNKVVSLLGQIGAFNDENIQDHETIKKLARELVKVKKEEKVVSESLTNTQEKELELLKEKAQLTALGNTRASDTYIAYSKLEAALDRANEKIAKMNDTRLTSLSIEDLIAGDFSKAEQILPKVSDAYNDLVEIEKLSYEYVAAKNAEAKEYASTILSAAETGFSDILSGDSDLATFSDNLTSAIRKSFADAIAEGIFDNILKDGLIEQLIGGSLTKIRDLFGGAEKISKEEALQNQYFTRQRALYDYHIAGIKGALGAGDLGEINLSRDIATPTKVIPGVTPGYGANTPAGVTQTTINGQPVSLLPSKTSTSSLSSTLSGIGGTALLAYGAGSSFYSAAGGGSLGLGAGLAGAAGAGILGASMMGAFGLATPAMVAAGTANAWNPVGWALLAAAAVMSIVGMSRGKPKWQQEEITEQTKQITSKIDVSNSELAWVNRNLVALRNELTYILPRSAYFSEQVSDNFSVDAQRGVF